jgi:osmotically-inducible protein OsmY
MEEVRIMKKIMMVVVALIISVIFVTMVMAQDKAKSMSWVGEVVSVDSAAKTVVAKNKKGEMTFDVSAAKLAKNVKLDGLNAGDKITVKYEEKDGKNMATSVAMVPGKKAKSKNESAGEYIDDSVITTKIKSLLAADDFLKSFKIGVKTRKGVVQLSGFVNSQQAVDKAVEITNSVKGVKSLKNDLIVK